MGSWQVLQLPRNRGTVQDGRLKQSDLSLLDVCQTGEVYAAKSDGAASERHIRTSPNSHCSSSRQNLEPIIQSQVETVQQTMRTLRLQHEALIQVLKDVAPSGLLTKVSSIPGHGGFTRRVSADSARSSRPQHSYTFPASSNRKHPLASYSFHERRLKDEANKIHSEVRRRGWS